MNKKVGIIAIIVVILAVGVILIVTRGYSTNTNTSAYNTNTNTNASANRNTNTIANNNTTSNTSTTTQRAVSINDMSFQPSSFTVASGTTVTWTNNDSVAHTVTGTNFDSGILQSGQTYSHTFSTAGTFAYHCTIHPSMLGSVIVQ